MKRRGFIAAGLFATPLAASSPPIQLAAEAITSSGQIAAGTITATQIGGNTITASELAIGAIVAPKIIW